MDHCMVHLIWIWFSVDHCITSVLGSSNKTASVMVKIFRKIKSNNSYRIHLSESHIQKMFYSLYSVSGDQRSTRTDEQANSNGNIPVSWIFVRISHTFALTGTVRINQLSRWPNFYQVLFWVTCGRTFLWATILRSSRDGRQGWPDFLIEILWWTGSTKEPLIQKNVTDAGHWINF